MLLYQAQWLLKNQFWNKNRSFLFNLVSLWFLKSVMLFSLWLLLFFFFKEYYVHSLQWKWMGTGVVKLLNESNYKSIIKVTHITCSNFHFLKLDAKYARTNRVRCQWQPSDFSYPFDCCSTFQAFGAMVWFNFVFRIIFCWFIVACATFMISSWFLLVIWSLRAPVPIHIH